MNRNEAGHGAAPYGGWVAIAALVIGVIALVLILAD